jgi:hypothetical protein
MNVISIILVAILFFTGCTTQREIMSSWEGSSADRLLAKWGAPDSSIQLDNGGRVLTWTSFGGGGNQPIQTCRQSFTVNSRGIITEWSYSGCQEWLLK